MMKTTLADVITDIATGAYDSDLANISIAIRARIDGLKGIKKATMFAALQVGDRVKFNDSVNPKYMKGVFATVTAKRRTKVSIKLDSAVGKFRAGEQITTPVTIVDKV